MISCDPLNKDNNAWFSNGTLKAMSNQEDELDINVYSFENYLVSTVFYT